MLDSGKRKKTKDDKLRVIHLRTVHQILVTKMGIADLELFTFC